jgi:hypothetical protein
MSRIVMERGMLALCCKHMQNTSTTLELGAQQKKAFAARRSVSPSPATKSSPGKHHRACDVRDLGVWGAITRLEGKSQRVWKRVPQGSVSVSFPADRHRGVIGEDGTATVYAMMPAALQLFAEGRLPRVGGDPVEVAIGGRNLGSMGLTEVRGGGKNYRHDIAVLVFRPANGEASS